MSVTHPQLVAALVKNPRSIIETLSEYTTDLWHGATGVAGECGELLEGIMITQDFRGDDELAAGKENFVEEAGDIFFYTEQLVQRTGIVLDWDAIHTFARNQHLGPDQMVNYTIHVAVRGSQVLDTVKKAAIYNKPLDMAALLTQLTEMCKYLVTLCYMFGVEHKYVLGENIRKLSKRYEGLQYTDKAAQLRADKPIERKPFPGEPADENPVNVEHRGQGQTP